MPATRANDLLADEGLRAGEMLATVRIRAGDFHRDELRTMAAYSMLLSKEFKRPCVGVT